MLKHIFSFSCKKISHYKFLAMINSKSFIFLLGWYVAWEFKLEVFSRPYSFVYAWWKVSLCK